MSNAHLIIYTCFICFSRESNVTKEDFSLHHTDYLNQCNRIYDVYRQSDRQVPARSHATLMSSSPRFLEPFELRFLACIRASLTAAPDEDDDANSSHHQSSSSEQDYEVTEASDNEETAEDYPNIEHFRNYSSISPNNPFLLNQNPKFKERLLSAGDSVSSSSSAYTRGNQSDAKIGGGGGKIKVKPFNWQYNMITMIFLIILYTLTVVVAIVSNLLVILVMCYGVRSPFLDISIYLMNLSIFNLLMAIFCIPFTFINTLLGKWVFSSFMCRFTNFIQMLSVNGCIFTLTALAINRFFAVAYPLKYNSSRTKRQKRTGLILVWLCSIGLSSIQLFIYKCVCVIKSSSAASTSLSITGGGGGSSLVPKAAVSVTLLNNFTAAASSPPKCCVPRTKSGSGLLSAVLDKAGNGEYYCICKEIWDSNEATSARYYLAYTFWIFMQTYCIPVLILLIMYSRIIAILRNRNSNGSGLQESSLQISEQHEYIKTRTKKVKLALLLSVFNFFKVDLDYLCFFKIYSLKYHF